MPHFRTHGGRPPKSGWPRIGMVAGIKSVCLARMDQTPTLAHRSR
jgi:hypothetical protein